jgi:ATP-dependent Clp protease adaptor protein ClpS
MSTLFNPTSETETTTITVLDNPWSVIVHNDPINLMSYVVLAFQKVLGMPKAQATKHMLEVHQKGRSVVWTGHKEEAELYMSKLQRWRLTVSIEQLSPE